MSVLSENPDNLRYSDLFTGMHVSYQYTAVYTVQGTEAPYVKDVQTVYQENSFDMSSCLSAKVADVTLEEAIRFDLIHEFNTYGVALQDITPPEGEYPSDPTIAKLYVATMPLGRMNDKPVTSALVKVRK